MRTLKELPITNEAHVRVKLKQAELIASHGTFIPLIHITSIAVLAGIENLHLIETDEHELIFSTIEDEEKEKSELKLLLESKDMVRKVPTECDKENDENKRFVRKEKILSLMNKTTKGIYDNDDWEQWHAKMVKEGQLPS